MLCQGYSFSYISQEKRLSYQMKNSFITHHLQIMFDQIVKFCQGYSLSCKTEMKKKDLKNLFQLTKFDKYFLLSHLQHFVLLQCYVLSGHGFNYKAS